MVTARRHPAHIKGTSCTKERNPEIMTLRTYMGATQLPLLSLREREREIWLSNVLFFGMQMAPLGFITL